MRGTWTRPPLIERTLAKVIVSPTGCWLWNGSRNAEGYGLVVSGGGDEHKLRVHRVVYEHFVGPIPEGLTLDHLCRVRHCVNPDHLQVVTRGENVMRGIGIAPANAAKTHCTHGHELTPENTYRRPGGTRECRTCVRDRNRENYRRRKVEAAA